MRILVSVVASHIDLEHDNISLDVFPEMTLKDIKAIVADEIKVTSTSQHYFYNNQPLVDENKTLTELNIGEGDMLALAIQDPQASAPRRRTQQAEQNQQRAQRPRQGPDPEQLRLQLLADPRVMEEVRSQAPDIAEAAHDRDRFHAAWDERSRQMEAARLEKEEQIALLNADPFNMEAQAKIENMIRQERVQENMHKALEENPESFARVNMLYIDVLVNNVPIKAFVDSGAQTTIMSPDAAKKCNIERLIDTRYGGIARGVGTAKILGRVHSADIQIGQYNLASSFTVMEGKEVELLLGLDMLKRHQMCIDLRENCLIVQDDKIPFLGEAELPKMMDEILEEEPKVEGPAGTTVGARTGTVEKADAAGSSSQDQGKPTGTGDASSSKINIHPAGSAGNIISKPNASASKSATASPAPTRLQEDSPFGTPQPITEASIRQITDMGFRDKLPRQRYDKRMGMWSWLLDCFSECNTSR